jgi:hypothetical protein
MIRRIGTRKRKIMADAVADGGGDLLVMVGWEFGTWELGVIGGWWYYLDLGLALSRSIVCWLVLVGIRN